MQVVQAAELNRRSTATNAPRGSGLRGASIVAQAGGYMKGYGRPGVLG